MKKERTLFLFENHDESFFFELEGNFKHLNNTYIGEDQSMNEYELERIIYIDKNFKKIEEPTKNWTYFVKCGDIS